MELKGVSSCRSVCVHTDGVFEDIVAVLALLIGQNGTQRPAKPLLASTLVLYLDLSNLKSASGKDQVSGVTFAGTTEIFSLL
jgi:hypothetical protein